MQLIPAIDIKGGKCVRLTQGNANLETVYSDDPVAMACHWDEEGAKTIHVVDLDGAFHGSTTNLSLVRDIINSSSVNIQVGGGIRTMKAVENYVDLGAARIVLGTVAFKNPEFVGEAAKRFPNKIMVGIDARDGKVAIKGWVEVSNKKASDFARNFEELGISGYILKEEPFSEIQRCIQAVHSGHTYYSKTFDAIYNTKAYIFLYELWNLVYCLLFFFSIIILQFRRYICQVQVLHSLYR